MDLLINDLSLHEQFPSFEAFQESIRQTMRIREVARRHRRTLFCHRGFVNGIVSGGQSLAAAVQALSHDERRSVMAWLSQQGPFWDDKAEHDSDDWYECQGEIVTETAVAEVAHCVSKGVDRGLVSLDPSNYTYDPVTVQHVDDGGSQTSTYLKNFWVPEVVADVLSASPVALDSWSSLQELSLYRFESLKFADYAFQPLSSQPFNKGVAERFLILFETLNKINQCFDKAGRRTSEGHEIYQQHFTGNKAWFSDSTESEKDDFENELKFVHPDGSGTNLDCTWHGKVKTPPQFRCHFSWPAVAGIPIYVCYVGPKITKR